MTTLQKVRIVLSSPGDVEEERRIMQDVVDELNQGIAADRDLHLELNRWETDAYPGFHSEGPQGIADQILKIEDCDILLGIFWKRFGTPTGNALSGTEHEIRTAIKCWKQSKRPEIMMYFKEAPFCFQNEDECNQQGLVIRFRDEFPKEGLYWTFEDVTEFKELTRRHLSNFIRSQYPLPGIVDKEGLQKDGPHDYIRDYCRRILNRFSTMYLFGEQRLRVDD